MVRNEEKHLFPARIIPFHKMQSINNDAIYINTDAVYIDDVGIYIDSVGIYRICLKIKQFSYSQIGFINPIRQVFCQFLATITCSLRYT